MSSNSESDHCHYVVPRKKRRCRMLIKPGRFYCGEHSHLLDNSNEKVEQKDDSRIPCPLDPKHSCLAKSLEKHLKKCPSKVQPCPNYVKPGINVLKDDTKIGGLALSKSSDEQLLNIISRVNKVYDEFVKDTITKEVLKHDLIETELKQDHIGPSASKHLVQNSSLLGHLEQMKALSVSSKRSHYLKIQPYVQNSLFFAD